MKITKTRSLLCFSALSALSSQAFAFGRPKGLESLGKIKVASDVPKSQAQRLADDLTWLASLETIKADEETLRVLGLPASNSESLNAWIQDRIGYIVSNEWTPSASTLKLERRNYAYSHPGMLPELNLPTKTTDGASSVKTIMSNMGAAVYVAGKKSGSLLAAKVPGQGDVVVRSPRVGLLKIGDGLFDAKLRSLHGYSIESNVGIATRLSTLFHEARHSDGNGTTLGFFHAICPAGHDYEGYAACDKNLNGPYTVGGLVARTLAESCAKCSEDEREALKVIALDQFDRVLKTTKLDSKSTELELSMLRTMDRLCNDSLMAEAVKEECTPEKREARKLRTEFLEKGEIPSMELDANPEGSR